MKFEYKIINVSREHLKKEKFQSDLLLKLNELGNEGWELISTEGIIDSNLFWNRSYTSDILYTFKRKIQ